MIKKCTMVVDDQVVFLGSSWHHGIMAPRSLRSVRTEFERMPKVAPAAPPLAPWATEGYGGLRMARAKNELLGNTTLTYHDIP